MTPQDHQDRAEQLLAEAEDARNFGDHAAANTSANLAQAHFFAAQSKAATEGMARTVHYLAIEQERIARHEEAAAAARAALQSGDARPA